MTNAPELSRPVRLDTLGEGDRAVSVTTTETERAALAARFGLVAIDALEAEVSLRRLGERIDCEGRLRATVTQSCVASGDPVRATLDEPFAIRFVPAQEGEMDEEIELGADDLDTIEYDGSSVDVGEAVAQTLALALDPFPRAPGAEQALRDAGVMDEEEAGPFAALGALKGRL